MAEASLLTSASVLCLQEVGDLFALPHELINDYEILHAEGCLTALLIHSDFNSRIQWWSGSAPEFCFKHAPAVSIDGVGFLLGYLCDTSKPLAEYIESVRQLSVLLRYMSHILKVHCFVIGLDSNVQLPEDFGVRCGQYTFRDFKKRD